MDIRAMGVMAGLAGGIDKATQNIVNISMAKNKLNMEKETFKLDYKVKEAELKKAEYLYGPEKIAADMEALKAEKALNNAKTTLATIQISKEQQKQETELDKYSTAMNMVKSYLAGTLKTPGQVKIGDISFGGKSGEEWWNKDSESTKPDTTAADEIFNKVLSNNQ